MDFQAILNKVNAYINNFPTTFKNAPNDEKAAYISVGLGGVFVIIGLITLMVL